MRLRVGPVQGPDPTESVHAVGIWQGCRRRRARGFPPTGWRSQHVVIAGPWNPVSRAETLSKPTSGGTVALLRRGSGLALWTPGRICLAGDGAVAWFELGEA